MKDLNLIIKVKKEKKSFKEDIEDINKGILVKGGKTEYDSTNDWELKEMIERKNDLKYPKDSDFEERLETLDKELKKILDPKEADVLILKTLNHISPEEDSQCRKQLFHYLKPEVTIC